MIRNLCLALCSILLFCVTSNANVIVDNFINGDSMVGPPGSNDVDRGGGFTSDALLAQSAGGLNPTYSGTAVTAGTYNSSANFANGDNFALTYNDFGGNQSLALASGMGPFTGLIVPYSTMSSDWTLDVGSPEFPNVGPVALAAGSNNLFVPIVGLGGAVNLTLTFTYTGMAPSAPTLSFGEFGQEGNNLIAVTAAIPEPTTFMMFGTVVGMGLINRRRRK